MKHSRNFIAYGVLAGLLLGLPAIADDGPQKGAVEEIAQTTTTTEVVTTAPEGPPGEHPQWHHHGEFHHPQHMLSDDQLEKMSALKDAFMTATANERTQLHLLHRQMSDLMTRPATDRAAVLALQAKVNALRDNLAIKAVNYKLDKLAILTPEQRHERRKMELLHNVFGHHFGGFGGHGHGHEGGHGAHGGCAGGACH